MKWALLAGAVFLAASLTWLSRDPQIARHAYGEGSSLSTAPNGLSLARAYLAEKTGAPVASLLRPFSRAQLPGDAVVFRVQPKLSAQHGIRRGRFTPFRQDGGPGDGGADAGTADGGVGDAGGMDAGARDRADAGTGAGADAGGRTERDRERAVDVFAKERRSRPLLTELEERFVSRGGRLVIAIERDLGPLHVRFADDEPLAKVFPALPGVATLVSDKKRGLRGVPLVDATAIFTRGEAPAVARIEHGRGDIWLLANPEIFSNVKLGDGDHLRFLTALAGARRPVFFDEHAHGLSDDVGAFELLRQWGLGPACLLAAVAALGWFWRRGVTLGPASPWRDLRTESIDLAYAIGELYGRTLSGRDQVALHHARLVHEIQLRQGLNEAAAAIRARELAPDFRMPTEGDRIGQAELRSLLAKLNDAFRRLRDGHRKRS